MNASLAARRTFAALVAAVLVVAGGLVATPGVASAAGVFSFDAGNFTPRQVKHVWWNNANSDAYAVGLAVSRLEQYKPCGATVTRQWYERQPNGEREFHLNIEEYFGSPCQVTVYLTGLTMYRQTFMTAMAPGATWSSHWNNAHSDQSVYVVGVLADQSASGACKLEVSTHYRTQPSGENEFYYTAKNVGSVTCAGELRHVKLPVQWNWTLGTYDPEGRTSVSPNTFAGTARPYVAGAVPGTTSAGECRFDLTPVTYFDSGRFSVDYTNAGSVRCGLTSTFSAP